MLSGTKRNADAIECAEPCAKTRAADEEECHIATLPTELVEIIARYAGSRGYMALAKTCRRTAAILLCRAARKRAVLAFMAPAKSPSRIYVDREFMECHINANWLDGVGLHGLYEAKTPKGVLVERCHYFNGRRHGLQSLFTAADGTLYRTIRWDCGWRHGPDTSYAAVGCARTVTMFRQDKEVSHDTFDNDGSRIRIVKFDGGSTHEWWSANGALVAFRYHHRSNSTHGSTEPRCDVILLHWDGDTGRAMRWYHRHEDALRNESEVELL